MGFETYKKASVTLGEQTLSLEDAVIRLREIGRRPGVADAIRQARAQEQRRRNLKTNSVRGTN